MDMCLICENNTWYFDSLERSERICLFLWWLQKKHKGKNIRRMTRIILDVPQGKDLDLLLALLERLDIRIVQRTVDETPPLPAPAKNDQEFILKGLPERKDFEAFVREFEESRQDRPLPGRRS
jgi:hypothetical protein